MAALALFLILQCMAAFASSLADMHPFSGIDILRTTFALNNLAEVAVSSSVLGAGGESTDFVNVTVTHESASNEDWIAVFSPANLSDPCLGGENDRPLCTAPIKFLFCNSSPDYVPSGKGEYRLFLVNQRSDYTVALVTGFNNPKLVTTSKTTSFRYPNQPVFPRLAQGKEWNKMTVTWTSGYGVDSEPYVEYALEDEASNGFMEAPAGTITFDRESMCGEPARTIGWRNPGYTHTAFLDDLKPSRRYVYRIGHRKGAELPPEQLYKFTSAPFPGQKSLQRIVVFSNMGKADPDGSNRANVLQPGSLLTTDRLKKEEFDMAFHLGDLAQTDGFVSQWDAFTAQIEDIASRAPYMVASGNRDRDWPNTGSFYANKDSGGECGVPAETMFYTPSENRARPYYSTDFGMFRFCVAHTGQDWREGTDQFKFIDHCFSSVNRRKQPWLIFMAHRILGYSSEKQYAEQGSFGEPTGRGPLEELFQKYKVDIAMFGHAQHYERTSPVYQNERTNNEKNEYRGMLDGTIHLVVGGGGAAPIADFSEVQPSWSLFRDANFGFVKLSAFNHSTLLCEYKRSEDGKIHDYFTINKEYRDILACGFDSCAKTTLAT